MDLSSNSMFKESTFLSAIQSHFCLDRLMISCCSAVLLLCAYDDCTPMINRNNPTNDNFIKVVYLKFDNREICCAKKFILRFYIPHPLPFVAILFFLLLLALRQCRRSCYPAMHHASAAHPEGI